MNTFALAILRAYSIDLSKPTLIQLSRVTPSEWLIVLDAIIDRTLPEPFVNELTSGSKPPIPYAVLSHRWIERQLQSVEKLRPLMPWWIGGQL